VQLPPRPAEAMPPAAHHQGGSRASAPAAPGVAGVGGSRDDHAAWRPAAAAGQPVLHRADAAAGAGFNLLPLGRQPGLPDLLAWCWCSGTCTSRAAWAWAGAFVFGLADGRAPGRVLGQHALAYTLLSFGRHHHAPPLLWFGLPAQACRCCRCSLPRMLVSLVVRLAAGGMFPGWTVLLAPVFEAAAVAAGHCVLLAPQRRAPDPDENRPL
jgi:rod shape-determining protein MreD